MNDILINTENSSRGDTDTSDSKEKDLLQIDGKDLEPSGDRVAREI